MREERSRRYEESFLNFRYKNRTAQYVKVKREKVSEWGDCTKAEIVQCI